MARFFGVDLASSPERPSAAVVLGLGLKAVYAGQLFEDEAILEMVSRFRPFLVAIDSPLTLPLGLGCLEEPCACGHCQAAAPKLRACELELRGLGIGCFYTTKRSIIRDMVYRGMRLKGVLEKLGFEVIEVYPYATKRLLWPGEKIPRKTTPEGLAFLRAHLARLLPSLRFYLPDMGHDLADAALAAYTAYLACRGEGEALGDPQEGQIVVPRLTPGRGKA